ncbi:MAG TPA: hypothetical protein VN579_01595 [Bryobacteraceae bacterium]|nr:hypothetical protein [Bryobacteraceae bacterium]
MKQLQSTGGRTRLLAAALPVLLLLAPSGASAQTLDTTQFVVIGEGLAAGMADFGLRDIYQKASFPAQMAAQMKTAFPQPIIQSPGMSGGTPGFNTLPAGAPFTLQGAGRNDFPPQLFVFNLAMPGATVSDALNLRPASPLIQPANNKQTTANLILGYPSLIIKNNVPYWSEVEYATAMNPTLVVVELGYSEVLAAAATNDPSKLPSVATFTSDYKTILSRLKANGGASPQVVVMTIPDPFDTAYFTSLKNAGNYLSGAPANQIAASLGLKQDDYLTPTGLLQGVSALVVSNGTLLSAIPNAVVNASTQAAVEANLAALNSAITSAAKDAGAYVFDLQAVLHQVRQNGLTIGAQTLTADYLGGFYSLDGYYPGQTGQALIANQMLAFLNSTYKTNFGQVDITSVVKDDPAGRLKPSVRQNNTPVPLSRRRLDMTTLRGRR